MSNVKLLFEGFLEKRKDTLKIRWVTYWFRLQNTTLFFYTKKNGSASHLRGYYYIYTFQSVREVHKSDKKRFMFEIIMTNGKRKVLSADSAVLRKHWVENLWQAMNLSCGSDSRVTRFNSTSPSGSDPLVDPPPRPLSAPSDLVHPEASSSSSSSHPQILLSEASPPLNPSGSILNQSLDVGLSVYSCPEASEEENGDVVYDTLPRRNTLSPDDDDDGVYDVPVSCRRSAEYEEATDDSVYDVPSCLLRKMSDHTIDEQTEEETYWRI